MGTIPKPFSNLFYRQTDRRPCPKTQIFCATPPFLVKKNKMLSLLVSLCALRLPCQASIQFCGSDLARRKTILALGRDENLPASPAYILKVNGAVRASLFMDPSNHSNAVRMVYDPAIEMMDVFPTFRQLVYGVDRKVTVHRLPPVERASFLYL